MTPLRDSHPLVTCTLPHVPPASLRHQPRVAHPISCSAAAVPRCRTYPPVCAAQGEIRVFTPRDVTRGSFTSAGCRARVWPRGNEVGPNPRRQRLEKPLGGKVTETRRLMYGRCWLALCAVYRFSALKQGVQWIDSTFRTDILFQVCRKIGFKKQQGPLLDLDQLIGIVLTCRQT